MPSGPTCEQVSYRPSPRRSLKSAEGLRIFHGDRLYLKVDERSKADFVSRGMGPFSPNGRQTLKSYYEVSSDVLANPQALLAWAREAIRAGMDSGGPSAPG